MNNNHFVLKDNNNIINTIYHFADIHIRNTQIDEYMHVFNNLFMILKKDIKKDQSLIVLCGDILHEKCRYTNKTIELFNYFMDNLSRLADIIVIMGNHDSGILNNNRQDGLRCLLERPACGPGLSNIYYLWKSGIYFYNNIAFGVSSLYDDGFISASMINCQNKIKIGLYHGSVTGCLLDNDFIMSQYDRRQEEFDGYNYVLLGDIHKHQYLNKKKTICYPSSLIQQNHGEDLLNHGFVKWNLAKKTSEFIRVPNDYGYVTFYIDNGQFIKLPKYLPKYIKGRIIYSNTEKEKCKLMCSQLEQSKQVQISYHNWEYRPTITMDKVKKLDEVYDIVNVNNQNDIIKKYLLENNKLNETEIKEIINLNIKLHQQINARIKKQCNKFNLLNLKFCNMFVYGENNEINFKNMKGIISIHGENRYGKSSLIDILLFALYGRCTKNTLQKEYLNHRKNNLICIIEFEINNDQYMIIRHGQANKKKTTVKFFVDFYKWEKTEYKCISDVDSNHTQKKIEEYVGTYEDILLTNILTQNETGFINLSNSERIDYLIKLNNMDIFDELYDIALSEYKTKQIMYDTVIRDLRKYDMESLNRSLIENNELIQKKLQILDSLQLEYKYYTDRINEMYKKMTMINEKIDKSEYDDIETKLKEHIEKKNNILKDIEKSKNNLNEISVIDQHLSISWKQKGKCEYIHKLNDDINSKISKYEKIITSNIPTYVSDSMISGIKHKINNDTAELVKIKNNVFDDNYSNKLTQIMEIQLNSNNNHLNTIKELQKLNDDVIKNTNNEIFSLYQMKKLLEKSRNDMLKILEDEDKITDNIISYCHQKEIIMNMQKDCLNVYNELEQINLNIIQYQQILDRYINTNKIIEHNKNIENEIELIIQNKKENEKEIEMISNEIKQLELQIHDDMNTLKTCDDKKDIIKQYDDDLIIYKRYIEMMKRNGIPSILIDGIIETLQDKANELLKLFDFPYTLNIRKHYTTKLNLLMSLIDPINNRPTDINGCCGSEQFILNFVIRLSMIEITNISTPTFVSIDEGFYCIDKVQMENVINNLYNILRNRFNFSLIISHNDTIRERCDTSISIIKDKNHFSAIYNKHAHQINKTENMINMIKHKYLGIVNKENNHKKKLPKPVKNKVKKQIKKNKIVIIDKDEMSNDDELKDQDKDDEININKLIVLNNNSIKKKVHDKCKKENIIIDDLDDEMDDVVTKIKKKKYHQSKH